ncbi:MAG TPA: YkgJ family cysteine cluster protein [Pirellulaceae bacterium]|nr:YkgJ family cysteine cluster protein [Pirellulaceae bacterium]HMO92439.1 YkgJ family cysteine cluster protein [Pirellulaceae bacterium]HMP67891.1 YkgJ family cysteine cluster protein [Pirellulaceae bacterium]
MQNRRDNNSDGERDLDLNEDDGQPWYAGGLQFQCTGCGDCCTGAPGYVWVNKEEIRSLAERVELTVEQFMQVYVRRVGVRYSLKEYANGDCIFFDNKRRNCKVYQDRPRQCRTWPFWDSNIRTPEAWEHTCKICPGSGTGKLYSLEVIEEQRQQIRI